MTRSSGVVMAVLGTLCGASLTLAQSVATTSLHVGTSVAPRASLLVSSSHLRFVVHPGGATAVAAVSYRAAVRTRRGGDVRVVVEPGGALGSARQAGESQPTVACGEPSTDLAEGRPVVVAAWRDSGVREGALVCRLEGVRPPGRYSLPVRFSVVLD
jgi:hypothetical protein